MSIGLYQLKYRIRKFLECPVVLSLGKKVNPNHVSLTILPVGMVIAYLFWTEHFLLGSLFILLRMLLQTFDGFIADYFKKGSHLGEILNRLTPEIADTLLLAALAWSDPYWGMAALCTTWITSFSGLIGLAINKPINSTGPVGQVDRLAALILFSLCSLLPFSISWMRLFLIWCTFGGAVTIFLRLKKICQIR
jgi:phosphatidylglycerophosphate synthase